MLLAVLAHTCHTRGKCVQIACETCVIVKLLVSCTVDIHNEHGIRMQSSPLASSLQLHMVVQYPTHITKR